MNWWICSVRTPIFPVQGALSSVRHAATQSVLRWNQGKGRNEIGVAEARHTCATKYLPQVVSAASEARVFAVIGVHAAREVSQLFHLGLDGEHRYAEFVHDGRPRAFVYLDHPSSGGKKKRFATAVTPEQLDRLRTEFAATTI